MEHKQYKTKGRERLLAFLHTTAHTPRTVEEICTGLAEGGERPAKSSVYRTLSELCRAGEIKRHRLPPPETGYLYEYVGTAHHCEAHFHLHCLRCGNVTHLECGCGREIAAHLRDKHGFVADCGRTVLYGVCAACTEKGAPTV